jgi:uncharacterized protein YcbK (DUF882 family)
MLFRHVPNGCTPLFQHTRRSGPARVARREFLRYAGVAALAIAPLGSLCARTSQRRSLSFVHTHTGESLSAAYFADGAYQPSSLERLNYLLRDFRTGDVHPIDTSVLDILFDLQTLANRDAPYQVICGYRSPRTNAALRSRSHGVAEHSLHMEGRAIDVRLDGFSTSKLHQLALGMQRGGVGFYPGADFIHLDNGRVRFW